MRVVIAGAAVLCLFAAQPASAAWRTSAPGPAKARTGQLQSPAPVTCAVRKVDWQPAGGPVQYRVWFNNGNKPDLVTAETTATAPGSGPVSVRVEAFVGSWAVETTTTNKICS